MLGGERQTAFINNYTDAPTYAETFSAALQKSTLQLNLMHDYVFPGLSSHETTMESAEKLALVNHTLSDPRLGYGQQGANMVGDMIGSLIPTLPFAFAGGALLKGASSAIGFGARNVALEAGSDKVLTAYIASQVPISKLATSALSHYLPNASAAQIATSLATSYGGYKGFTIPEHFASHYDAINNTLDTSHALQDWGSDNYGFLLGAVPLAAGFVAFKGIRGIIKHRGAIQESAAVDAELKRLFAQHNEVLKENQIKEGERATKQAKVSEIQDHLQQAEDMGIISPKMHEWYLDYLENPNDKTKVHEGGLEVLKELQIPYDRVTGRVWHEVLSRDGIKNLQGAMFDEGITNFSAEENQLLSSYIIHNELDAYVANMRENPNLLHAIQGMTDSLGEKIAANSLALKEFDHALTRHLPKGLLKRQILSQNNIFQNLKKFQAHLGRGVVPRDIPHTVPKEVAYKLKLVDQINKIEARKTRQYQLKFERGEHLKLKKKLKEIKLMLPAEELVYLRDTLMPEGILRSDFKKRKAYHRLEDLSQVWPNAQHLLDRIHMEAINAKQKGLNEILKKFTQMVDDNVARFADPDSVKRYLNSRIERAVPSTREFERHGIEFETHEMEVTKEASEHITPDNVFNESATHQINSSELQFAKERFETYENKYKQFSENEKALAELITCALGE